MKTAEFDYELPSELIAQTPVEPRDASRLMVVHRQTGRISHHHFRHLPHLLGAGDLLVHNESRVIPARLFARKPTGGQVEILLLRRHAERRWEALIGGKRVHLEMRLALLDGPDGQPTGAEATVIETGARGVRVLQFSEPALALAKRIGTTPLPPYIHTPLRDSGRYQTVYARVPGSAAAPTAGLHFTPELLLHLREMGVHSAFVNLHIGLDTFQPVVEENIEDHRMHTEFCSLAPEVAQRINEAKLGEGRVIAVGTTSVRVLETAALTRSGCRLHSVAAFDGPTNLFIHPGHEFRVVDALITNFHLPCSTLLMLVAAFVGKELLDRAYAEAIKKRYRFYSFGDAMLIL